MKITVARLYPRFVDAAGAVDALVAAGIPAADMRLVVNNAGNPFLEQDGATPERIEEATAPTSVDGAAAGAGAGAVAGGGIALLASLGLVVAPALAPLVAAGALAAAATGAAAGAAAGAAVGGLVDALLPSGLPQDRVDLFAEGLRRGAALVSVRADPEEAEEVAAILDRHGSVDPAVYTRVEDEVRGRPGPPSQA